MAKIRWQVGDRALTRDDKECVIVRIVREDGVDFAWIRYEHPADGPEGRGYVTEGVWEHGLRDRRVMVPPEMAPAGAPSAGWGYVYASERGLRPVTPIELTLEEAYEILDDFEQARAEAYAEAGGGAMSLGYGQDGAYAAASAAEARFGDGGRRVRAARERIKEAE